MCETILKSTSVAVSSGVLTVTFPKTVKAISNCEVLKLVICQTIPTTAPFATVNFVINGTTIPVYTKFHNSVRADQLRSRKVYCCGFATSPISTVILNKIPVSGFAFPKIPVPTSSNKE